MSIETEDEVQALREYMDMLGMDPEEDAEFIYIAREGVTAPIPEPWEVREGENGELIYHNPLTQEYTYKHPLDDYYRQKFLQAKAGKSERVSQIHNSPLETG